MGRGEYWRLIDSQGRPPGLLGMWPSRAVTFIENHDTGAAPETTLMAHELNMQRADLCMAWHVVTVLRLHARALQACPGRHFSIVMCCSGLCLMARERCAGSTLNHWPFPADHLHAGYCYIITHPGSPCIFYDHFVAEGLGQSIRELIAVRQKMRIQCRSKVGCTRQRPRNLPASPDWRTSTVNNAFLAPAVHASPRQDHLLHGSACNA